MARYHLTSTLNGKSTNRYFGNSELQQVTADAAQWKGWGYSVKVLDLNTMKWIIR